MKKTLTLVITVLATLCLSACGNNEVIGGGDTETGIMISSDATSTDVSGSETSESGSTEQLENPWTDYSTREEMEEAVGFNLDSPETFNAAGVTWKISAY
ncbi:MAG: hypothetical protein ACI4ET_03630 [Bilifractor sp.]